MLAILARVLDHGFGTFEAILLQERGFLPWQISPPHASAIAVVLLDELEFWERYARDDGDGGVVDDDDPHRVQLPDFCEYQNRAIEQLMIKRGLIGLEPQEQAALDDLLLLRSLPGASQARQLEEFTDACKRDPVPAPDWLRKVIDRSWHSLKVHRIDTRDKNTLGHPEGELRRRRKHADELRAELAPLLAAQPAARGQIVSRWIYRARLAGRLPAAQGDETSARSYPGP
ncbi:MAG: hypothetical protein R3C15_07215 [Thermoleophilia bacterium]